MLEILVHVTTWFILWCSYTFNINQFCLRFSKTEMKLFTERCLINEKYYLFNITLLWIFNSFFCQEGIDYSLLLLWTKHINFNSWHCNIHFDSTKYICTMKHISTTFSFWNIEILHCLNRNYFLTSFISPGLQVFYFPLWQIFLFYTTQTIGIILSFCY